MTAPALRSLLYGLSPGDPASFIAAGIFVAIVAAVATIVPVFHATRIKPAEALRIDA